MQRYSYNTTMQGLCTALTLGNECSQLTISQKNWVMKTCSKNKPVCTVPILCVRGCQKNLDELVQDITLGLFLKQNTLWVSF